IYQTWLCSETEIVHLYPFLFFFSSRRRHTRFSRDWSSDVCSSDLVDDRAVVEPTHQENRQGGEALAVGLGAQVGGERHLADVEQIGRASCRERAEVPVVGVSRVEKKALEGTMPRQAVVGTSER